MSSSSPQSSKPLNHNHLPPQDLKTDPLPGMAILKIEPKDSIANGSKVADDHQEEFESDNLNLSEMRPRAELSESNPPPNNTIVIEDDSAKPVARGEGRSVKAEEEAQSDDSEEEEISSAKERRANHSSNR